MDLRDATMDKGPATVNVLAGFGNVNVYVPEGVNVDVGGLTVRTRSMTADARSLWATPDARTAGLGDSWDGTAVLQVDESAVAPYGAHAAPDRRPKKHKRIIQRDEPVLGDLLRL